jgi:hypothetical protein
MNDMLGCLNCGRVARTDSLEGTLRRCPGCGSVMVKVGTAQARKLVAARRRADRRRDAESAVADLGFRDEEVPTSS